LFAVCANARAQELVSTNANQRNWRGILIAVLVIVFVLALIVTSVVLLTPPDEGPRVKGHRFKLADVLGHEFLPLRFNGSWVSPHELIYLDHTGGISLLNVLNASSKVLMTNQTFVSIYIFLCPIFSSALEQLKYCELLTQ
jgi:inactive dipeptidyl peptidase 10